MGIWLTFAGILLSAITTICDKVIPHEKVSKRTWLSLTAVGLIVASLSVIQQDRDQQKENAQRDAAILALTTPVSSLVDVPASLTRIEASLNELLVHAAIRPTMEARVPVPRYYVQIAADAKRQNLEPFLANLEHRFGTESGAAILDKKPPSQMYRLVWGQHLERAAAEQRKKAAEALRLPPPGQAATIGQE